LPSAPRFIIRRCGKARGSIDQISKGRISLNVVSAWVARRGLQYGLAFDEHDARYERTAEWLAVVDGAWSQHASATKGRTTRRNAILEPKPVRKR